MMVRRLASRDLLWVALISGAFALLTVQVVMGLRGFDRPPPVLAMRLLAAPGVALGWGGVALLLVAIPYALLAWMRGKSPGKAISAIGALVLALGIGGVAAVLASTPRAGGGVLGGALGGMLRDALGSGLAVTILALIAIPGLFLSLVPLLLEAKGAGVAASSISVAPAAKPRYPQRRLGPDGEELPMEFEGGDVGAVRLRPPDGTPPPPPEPLTARVTLSPPAIGGPALKKQKPIAGVRYADEPDAPVTEPIEAQEAPKEVEKPRDAGLPSGVRYADSSVPEAPPAVEAPAPAVEAPVPAVEAAVPAVEAAAPVAEPAPVAPPVEAPGAAAPTPPAALPEPRGMEAPPLEALPIPPPVVPSEPPTPEAAPTPAASGVATLAPARAAGSEAPAPVTASAAAPAPTPGLAASVSDAAAGLRAALEAAPSTKTSRTLDAVVGEPTSARSGAEGRPGSESRGSAGEHRRKLAETGMFDATRAEAPRPPRPPKPRPRLARPDSLQDAIRGLFSSLPLEELPPVATLDEPEPPPSEPVVDAPGQTTLFELDPKTGKLTKAAPPKAARHAATQDPLYPQALAAARERGSASLVMLKRTLGVGYARAASLMDALVAEGVLGEMTASGSRPTT